MLIDHIGAGVVWNIIVNEDILGVLTYDLNKLYTILRGVGRISFPIFVFLLVESFYLTSNRKKMSVRLFLFALISEPFFDLCFNDKFLELGHQNIYFTLLLGFLGMWFATWIKEKEINYVLSYILGILGFVSLMTVVELIHTDYGSVGVFAIAVFYYLRGGNRIKRVASTIIGFGTTVNYKVIAPVYLATIPIFLYNGKRGRQNKYLFYFFYPVHLFLIYLIRIFLFSVIFA